MGIIGLILLVFAFVLFVVAGFIQPDHPWRAKLGLFGLACWVLAELLGRVGTGAGALTPR